MQNVLSVNNSLNVLDYQDNLNFSTSVLRGSERKEFTKTQQLIQRAKE